MTREEIASVLKSLRLESGKTQKEVAELLGRKQPIIGHWETGYSQPDANTLFTLCEIYGTTVDAAFGFKKKDVEISKNDLNIIKMYHNLDPCGTEIVDFILKKEYERSTSISPQPAAIPVRLISYYYKNASAGTGQIIFDYPPDTNIEIPDIQEYKNVSYAIGVNGSSMEPLYHDGDILLIEATREMQIGDIGIFQVNEECFVKKLGESELISLNPDFPNIPLNDSATVLGKVIDLFHPK